MKLRRKAELIFWMVTLGALPAWANNPPQPDGLFSIILIFPVAIIGFRLAGAVYTESERKWRVLRGLLLGLAVIVSLAGTALAMVPLVLLLVFGCMRGVQIIVRGQGSKRVVIGLAVCLWTLFAVSDYIVSLEGHSPGSANEASAVSTLRMLATAEGEFSKGASRTKVPTFGTLDDLAKAGLIDRSSVADRRGYRFDVALSENGRKFFVSAVPTVYGSSEGRPAIVPGESWLRQLGTAKPKATGSRSFAVDESEVIRFSSDQMFRPPTREEAEKWKPLQ